MKRALARRLALSLLWQPFSLQQGARPRQREWPVPQRLGATPLPVPGTPRLLKLVPMLGMPLPLGMTALLPLAMMLPLVLVVTRI